MDEEDSTRGVGGEAGRRCCVCLLCVRVFACVCGDEDVLRCFVCVLNAYCVCGCVLHIRFVHMHLMYV